MSSIVNNGSLNQTYSLTYDKIVLSSNKIALAKSGNLIFCGFYNSTSGPSEKFKLLSENQLINSMSSSKQNKTKKKMAKGLSIIMNSPKNNYNIMELRPNNDGGFVFIAEHQIIPHKQPFEVVEIYGDLIIAQIGNNGVINNINTIVKDQRQSMFGSTSSFAYINVKNNVCILFNDHKQNINLIDSGHPKLGETRCTKGAYVLVTINKSGLINKKIAFLNSKYKLRFQARKSIIISENQFLLYGEKTLGRISIE